VERFIVHWRYSFLLLNIDFTSQASCQRPRLWLAFFFDPWHESKAQKNTQNVKFEIDMSDYSERSTLIQPHQTQYPGENECLLSCYNILEWTGYKYAAGIPTVYLKVLNYKAYHDEQTRSIVGSVHADLPLAWFLKKGEAARTREMSPERFNALFQILCESYKRNAETNKWKQLTWLNATFN